MQILFEIAVQFHIFSGYSYHCIYSLTFYFRIFWKRRKDKVASSILERDQQQQNRVDYKILLISSQIQSDQNRNLIAAIRFGDNYQSRICYWRVSSAFFHNSWRLCQHFSFSRVSIDCDQPIVYTLTSTICGSYKLPGSCPEISRNTVFNPIPPIFFNKKKYIELKKNFFFYNLKIDQNIEF